MAGLPTEALEELARIPVLPTEAGDVRRVRSKRRDTGIEGFSGVNRMGRLRRPCRPHSAHPSPRLDAVDELVVEDPPVARIAHTVDDSPTDRDVIGLVEVPAAPGLPEVAGDHDVRPVLADLPGDRGAQRDAVLDDAVGKAEEFDDIDADDARRLNLLGLADNAALIGCQPVDPSLARGHHAVDEALALSGPARDRCCRPELQIIGVGDDAERGLPVLGQRLEAVGFGAGSVHLVSMAPNPLASTGSIGKGVSMSDRAPDLRIETVDADSDEELRAYWELEQAAQRADRAEPVIRGFGGFVRMVRDPSPYYDRHWLVARSGSELVGTAELLLSVQDNLHLGSVEINTHPGARRRGVGRAIHDEISRRARAAGRTKLLAEVNAADESGSPATAFAEALGYRAVHTEHHLRLRLPLAADQLAALGDTDPAYEIVGWAGACPPQWRAAYLAMRNQMNADVPMGETDYEPVMMDDERLSVEEQRSAKSYVVLVAAACHRVSGEFAGYSAVYLPHDDAILAHQDDTLVMPTHRGHHLGLSLKLANLERIAAEYSSREVVHTWTDPENTAMYRTNQRVGFEPVEILYEMELTL